MSKCIQRTTAVGTGLMVFTAIAAAQAAGPVLSAVAIPPLESINCRTPVMIEESAHDGYGNKGGATATFKVIPYPKVPGPTAKAVLWTHSKPGPFSSAETRVVNFSYEVANVARWTPNLPGFRFAAHRAELGLHIGKPSSLISDEGLVSLQARLAPAEWNFVDASAANEISGFQWSMQAPGASAVSLPTQTPGFQPNWTLRVTLYGSLFGPAMDFGQSVTGAVVITDCTVPVRQH